MPWPWIIILILLFTPPLSLFAGIMRSRYASAPLIAGVLIVVLYCILIVPFLNNHTIWFWVFAGFATFLVLIHVIMLVVGAAVGSREQSENTGHA